MGLSLSKALRASSDLRLAVVGSGGKTGTIFQLARQLRPPVLITTSTHIGTSQVQAGEQHFILKPGEPAESLIRRINGVSIITGPPLASEKRLSGLTDEQLAQVHVIADQLNCPLLIEADGSRQKPIKAPAAHEPAIPPFCSTVMVVVGLTGIGKPMNEDFVHRPEYFSKLTGRQIGDLVEPVDIEQYLLHAQGGLKNIPRNAQKVVLLNQADSPEIEEKAVALSKKLLPVYDAVLTAAIQARTPETSILRVATKIGGVLLAAGASTRLGQAKQLLEYRGKSFIRQVAETALQSGLSQLVVVLGAVDQPIRQALEGLPITFAVNPEWQTGQSGSVRAGLAQLEENVGGAVFLLSDQPQIPGELVGAMVERHQKTLAPIIAPSVGGKRGNPVLFDRDLFGELGQIQGDQGGRAVFHRHPVELVEWEDENILLDIDTPDDLARLQKEL